MARNTWFLYDSNLSYAEKLTDFFSGKEPLQVAMETYSRKENLQKRIGDCDREDVLIVTESCYEEWMSGAGVKLAILIEDGGISPDGAILLDRYQSAEDIWSELVAKLNAQGGRVRMKKTVNEKAGLISFFNPQHRVLQTTFALYYAKTLSEKAPTLFLHFDGLGSLGKIFRTTPTRTLMDLLYLWECGNEELMFGPEGGLYRSDALQIMLAAGSPADIRSVKEETWLGFLESLQEMGRFAYIVLDLHEYVEGLTSILQMSGEYLEVHRPENYEDLFDKEKLTEYENQMRRQGMEDLLAHRKVIRLPLLEYAPNLPEGLERGPLRDIAKNLLGEQAERSRWQK